MIFSRIFNNSLLPIHHLFSFRLTKFRRRQGYTFQWNWIDKNWNTSHMKWTGWRTSELLIHASILLMFSPSVAWYSKRWYVVDILSNSYTPVLHLNNMKTISKSRIYTCSFHSPYCTFCVFILMILYLT